METQNFVYLSECIDGSRTGIAQCMAEMTGVLEQPAHYKTLSPPLGLGGCTATLWLEQWKRRG